jgi:purine-nucleoside phosphorylase
MSAAFETFRKEVNKTSRETQEMGRPARLVALVLGSGMGAVTDRINPRAAVSFGDVPGLVPPTVAGHKGQIILGDLAGRPVLAFTGRLHFYEGHPWAKVVRPVEIAAELGAKVLVLTNAAGGINEALRPGSLMALTDHIEWNDPHTSFATLRRSVALVSEASRTNPYSVQLLGNLENAARDAHVPLQRGTYLSVTGPCYETPAEIRAAREIGADAVGMSTTREALRGAELGMEVLAISCVANRAAGLSGTPLSHKEVLEVVATASANLAELLTAFVEAT